MNVTVNHATPHVGERGKHLCLAQKHTRNISCILSMAIARPSYALRLYGAAGTGYGIFIESLVKAAGIDKEPAGTTQVNVQANIGLPFPQGVKKVAQFVEAVEEG